MISWRLDEINRKEKEVRKENGNSGGKTWYLGKKNYKGKEVLSRYIL